MLVEIRKPEPELSHGARLEESNTALRTFFFYVFLFYMIAWFIQLSARLPILAELRFEFVVAAILVVGVFLTKQGTKSVKSGILPFVILYSFVVTIHVPFSFFPRHSFDIYVDGYLKLAAFGLFVTHYVRDTRALKLFIFALLVAYSKILSESTIGALTGSMMWYNQGILRLHGSVPMWEHANSIAGLAVLSLIFPIYLIPIFRSFFYRAMLIGITICAIVCIIYSGSRSAYITVVAMLAFIAFLSRRSKVMMLGAVALMVMIAFTNLPQQYKDRINTMSTGQELAGNSMGMRRQIIDDAIYVFESHPFGIGVGAFPPLRTELFGRVQDTHNTYLEVATNLGVHGIIVFSLFIFAIFRLLIRTRSRLYECIRELEDTEYSNTTKQNEELAFLIACCNIFIVYLGVVLTQGIFGNKLYQIHWWIILGVAIVLFRLSSTVRADRMSTPSLAQEDSVRLG